MVRKRGNFSSFFVIFVLFLCTDDLYYICSCFALTYFDYFLWNFWFVMLLWVLRFVCLVEIKCFIDLLLLCFSFSFFQFFILDISYNCLKYFIFVCNILHHFLFQCIFVYRVVYCLMILCLIFLIIVIPCVYI